MKRITLIRHAKSDWHASLADFDRPLNARGEAAAPHMAAHLAEFFEPPDQLISSPAVRALRTAQHIAVGLGITEADIQTRDDLYNASLEDLLQVIQQTDVQWGHLMLIAHNPGITELANQLTDSHIDNLVTCAVLGADLDIANWPQARPGCGRVVYYDYPKNPNSPRLR